MNGKDFSEVVSLICKKDNRYDRAAYAFIREALDFTVKRQHSGEPKGQTQHVGGKQLCEGARDYALAQYGPMASTLLRHWGIRETADFGEIVFNLVDLEVFGTREEDSREDFAGIFDFGAAFEAPFLPNGAVSGSQNGSDSGQSAS